MMIRTKGVGLREGSNADVQDSYKYLGDHTGKWELWGVRKEVSHSQIATQSKAGSEKSAEWGKQGPSHQHVCLVSHQIPHWYNKLAKGRGQSPLISRQRSSSQCMEGFIPSPAPWDCTQRGANEAKDLWVSEPQSRMKQPRSRNTSGRWTPKTNH